MKNKILILMLGFITLLSLTACDEAANASLEDDVYLEYFDQEYSEELFYSSFSKKVTSEILYNALSNIKMQSYMSYKSASGDYTYINSVGLSSLDKDGNPIGMSKSSLELKGSMMGNGSAYSYVKDNVAYYSISQSLYSTIANANYTISGKYHQDLPTDTNVDSILSGGEESDDFISINEVIEQFSNEEKAGISGAKISKSNSFLGPQYYKIEFSSGMFSGFSESVIYICMNGKKFVGMYYEMKYTNEELNTPITIWSTLVPFKGDIELPDLSVGFEMTYEEYSNSLTQQIMDQTS